MDCMIMCTQMNNLQVQTDFCQMKIEPMEWSSSRPVIDDGDDDEDFSLCRRVLRVLPEEEEYFWWWGFREECCCGDLITF